MGRTLCPVVIGRDRELEVLGAALRDLGAGRGTCLVLTGEAGIGKSRLTRELAERAGAVPVAVGRAVPSGATEPYRPITEALLQLLRHRRLPDDPSMDPWRVPLAPLLPNLGGPPAAGAVAVPAAVRAEAVLQVLRRVTPEGVVVVLEDLHWADPDTLALIEYLADHVADQAAVLAVTCRTDPGPAASELIPRLWGRNRVVVLPLERLSPAETAEMVAACLPGSRADRVDTARVLRSAEGIPLLVEELLASPGVPESVAGAVTARLGAMPPDQRRVLEAAATLGRQFEWELLPATTGMDATRVTDALAAGVELQLLTVDGDVFRFRHALTRDAVLDAVLPPARRELAARALTTIDATYPEPTGQLRELAADLAVQAGQPARAGALLVSAGRMALHGGAIGTAIGTLGRAAELLEGQPEGVQAELALIEALALAGRVEEAASVGHRLIGRCAGRPDSTEVRFEAHLLLAQAAVSAARWPMAGQHLQAAAQLTGPGPAGEAAARMALLFSEVELAAGDPDRAGQRAEEALTLAGGEAPEVRCHALEMLGRSRRLRDTGGARRYFEEGLAVAEAADLPHWRLRALHEVGTIDMFDHVGVTRLLQARALAERSGAVTTAASLDLQLAACFTARWDLDASDRHARSALERAERFRLDVVEAKALALLSGTASMRCDAEAAERYARLARAVAPDDRWLQAFCLINRAMVTIMAGELDQSLGPFGEGMAIMGRIAHGEPASARAVWPLLLAARGDRRAEAAVDEARRLGVAAFRLNQGLLAYAQAVIAGRRGDTRNAEQIVGAAEPTFANSGPWLHLARLLAAPAAARDGWGDAVGWATGAVGMFGRLGVPGLAAHAAAVAARVAPNPWPGSGITEREAQVLELVARGRANKQIASELGLSVRTVEKHVESLLRKTGARSRTELAVGAAGT
ncbi:MAG TPA: AAA family ATPase [Acidimicrobiales bacterium]|nr:AAA family ATPase [Acidimicrobiales bacterium]